MKIKIQHIEYCKRTYPVIN